MAYGFRAWADGATAGSGGAYAINKPADTAEGDLLVAVLYLEADTNSWTTPSGWTAGPTQANTDLFLLATFWKIAGASEPASWDFTPTSSNWRVGGCAAFTGAQGTGTERVDVSGGAQGDSVLEIDAEAPSVTTTVDGDLVVFAYANIDGTDPTDLDGFALNLAGTHGGATIGYAVKSPAGATGTTETAGGVGQTSYAALHVAFLLDTGGGGSTAEPTVGSVQVTGSAGTLAFTMPPAAGALQVAGAAPTALVELPKQYAYPTSDVSNESWTASVGSDLYECVNEDGTPSDTDYIRSPDPATGQTVVLQLGSLNTPDAGAVTLRIRAKWVA